jgi:hypothetical protein
MSTSGEIVPRTASKSCRATTTAAPLESVDTIVSSAFMRIALDRLDTIQRGLAIENGVGEGHPAPRRGRLPSLVDDDSVAGLEQSVGNGRPDVAGASNQAGQHRD